jgi:hypothetical protein
MRQRGSVRRRQPRSIVRIGRTRDQAMQMQAKPGIIRPTERPSMSTFQPPQQGQDSLALRTDATHHIATRHRLEIEQRIA